jgi:hypothetical protein
LSLHRVTAIAIALAAGYALSASAEEASPRAKREMFGPFGLASGAIIDKTRELPNGAAHGPLGATIVTFSQLDRDGDGHVSTAEAATGRSLGFNSSFADLDTDGDGRISKLEWDLASGRTGAVARAVK